MQLVSKGYLLFSQIQNNRLIQFIIKRGEKGERKNN
jgi:hypothetical protein